VSLQAGRAALPDLPALASFRPRGARAAQGRGIRTVSALPDHDCVDPERRAAALIDIGTARRRAAERKRERAFTTREALTCLEFEAMLVAVAASNLAQGVELTQEDLDRLWLASERITTIVEEACR
jgi:hypothetical protein